MWLFAVFPMLLLYAVLGRVPKHGGKLQSAALVLLGLGLYSVGEPAYYMIFIASVMTDLIFGRAMRSERGAPHKKLLLITGVSLNALVLVFFKAMTFAQAGFVLPLGISFFTFRGISYLADIYTDSVSLSDNIADDLLYLTFFAQLQSGPITKFREFGRICSRTSPECVNNITQGVRRVMTGMCKKTLAASVLVNIADKAFAADTARLSPLYAWTGAVCYSLQLYYDFSGYSDMAIGLTNIFGYSCPENFNYPYASASVSEFWRRWHITLGHWFRDYVYIPLGGSRVSKGRLVLNLLAVWLLTGLWHGSALSFVVWGLMHFAFIVIERFTGVSRSEKTAVRIIWRCVTLTVVVLAWVMFRAGSVSHGLRYIGAMFTPSCPDPLPIPMDTFHIAVMAAAALFSVPVLPYIKGKAKSERVLTVYDIITAAFTAAGFFICLTLIANGANNTFVYANF